ncbi:MAG: HU family DNA-binding protein [Bacteroidales bacterium]|jgi:DNA-binding protein HU-beta|nr:HU family DNA-binding protein [Bacteroidales bacterium]
MNKLGLIDAMATNSGLSKVDCKKALEAYIESVSTTLKNGEKITLVGFGTFSISKKSARIGVNPSNKQKIQIPAKKFVKFKAGNVLAESI